VKTWDQAFTFYWTRKKVQNGKWSKTPHVLNLGTTLESMRTCYRRLDSRKLCLFRG